MANNADDGTGSGWVLTEAFGIIPGQTHIWFLEILLSRSGTLCNGELRNRRMATKSLPPGFI